MQKYIQLLGISFLLISCRGNSTDKIHPRSVLTPEKEEIIPLTFDEIIPEELTDSAKVLRMNTYMASLLNDSTLTRKEFKDSLGYPIFAVFRNDTLVKISKGGLPFDAWESHLIYISNTTEYTFLCGNVIHFRYVCNSSQHTGRCNPVRTNGSMYFYRDHIINEHHESSSGSYPFCGCDMMITTPVTERKAFVPPSVTKANELKVWVEQQTAQ